jgi:hypothetical protein
VKYWRQCGLRRKINDTTFEEQISYIPEPHCKEGKVLKLKDDDCSWVNGWEVIWCGERKSTEEVSRNSRDYLRTRKASDI